MHFVVVVRGGGGTRFGDFLRGKEWFDDGDCSNFINYSSEAAQ